MNLTEDDTFRRLKRWSFEDVSAAIPEAELRSHLSDVSFSAIFDEVGWKPEEWLEESFKRHEERIIIGNLKNKYDYIKYWLDYWNIK